MAHSEAMQGYLREHFRTEEYRLASRGQDAAIRIDAFPDRLLRGHVRTVAAVASQTDWMSSDVKVYQTLVTIDEPIDGLKPDMSAEVTIQVDPPKEPVLAVPVQAVVGGAEGGSRRKVFVAGPGGPAEREVTLGLFNEKMVEVRDGLTEGDQVVLNPKVLLAPGAKTREESEAPRRPGMGDGKGGAGKKGEGKKAGPGGGGGMKAGPPMKQ
jgi:multidrug efflux pump subunit AcrA (membrane-fusion protein)